jgi:Leucine-rich repeat (LRR) protein
MRLSSFDVDASTLPPWIAAVALFASGTVLVMTALRELNLNSTQVANLEPLRGLIALRTLDLSATKVADLTPLKDLPNLTKVNGVADEELKKLNAYRGSINLPLVK